MTGVCPRQHELREAVNAILARIDQLNQGQMEALKAHDDQRLMQLDKQMELTFGEKERSFGALFEHRKEHGC